MEQTPARLTAVIGLGNPILGDDSVGWKIAQRVDTILNEQSGASQLPEPAHLVQVDCLGVGGLRLMEFLIGFDRAVLIDAIHTGLYQPGVVRSFPLEAITDLSAGHLSSAHDTSVQNALKLGRSLGAHLPEEVWVVSVEIEPVIIDFSDELSTPVSAAVPLAIDEVLKLLT